MADDRCVFKYLENEWRATEFVGLGFSGCLFRLILRYFIMAWFVFPINAFYILVILEIILIFVVVIVQLVGTCMSKEQVIETHVVEGRRDETDRFSVYDNVSGSPQRGRYRGGADGPAAEHMYDTRIPVDRAGPSGYAS